MNFYVHPELVDYEGVVTEVCLSRFELDGGKVLLYAPVSMATNSTVHIAQAHALCRTSDRRTVLVCCEYSSVKVTNGLPAQASEMHLKKVGFRGLLWLEELSLLLQSRHQLQLLDNPTLMANVIDFFFGNQKKRGQASIASHKCSAFDEGVVCVPSSIGSVCEVVSSVQEAQWEPIGHKFTVATSDDRLLVGMLKGGCWLGDAGGSLPLLLPRGGAGGLVALQQWVLVGGKQLRAQHLRHLEEGSLEQQMETLTLNTTQNRMETRFFFALQEEELREICSIRDLYKSVEERISFTGVLDHIKEIAACLCLVLRDVSGASVRVYCGGDHVLFVPGSQLRLCPLRVRTSCSTGALYLQATPHTTITHCSREFPLSHVFRRLLCVDQVVAAAAETLTVCAGAWRGVCCGGAAKQISPLIAARCLLLQPKTLWCQSVESISTHRAALQLYAHLLTTMMGLAIVDTV